MATTITCRNTFLEEDGFCTSCGQNHWKMQPTRGRQNIQVLVERKQEKTQAEKMAAIERGIQAVPEYREAKALILAMAADLEIKVRVVFRNRERSSYCSGSKNKNGEWEIVLGYQMIDHIAKNGFREYATLEHLVPNPRPTGVSAAHWLAVHEFAHAVDMEENGNRYGIKHGASYQKVYKALIDLYLK